MKWNLTRWQLLSWEPAADSDGSALSPRCTPSRIDFFYLSGRVTKFVYVRLNVYNHHPGLGTGFPRTTRVQQKEEKEKDHAA